MTTFSKNLKRFRQAKAMTQEQAQKCAALCGLQPML